MVGSRKSQTVHSGYYDMFGMKFNKVVHAIQFKILSMAIISNKCFNMFGAFVCVCLNCGLGVQCTKCG